MLKQFDIFFIILVVALITSGCRNDPAELLPQEVEITDLTEEPAYQEISQTKIFDQCNSTSPLKAEIQFSQSDSKESLDELTLSGLVGGTAGLSEIAMIKLEGELRKRFSSISSTERGSKESITIEVPPRTKQSYTIIWGEQRNIGTVSYMEGDETKGADYNYLISLKLISSTVEDLPCQGQELAVNTAQPTQANTPAPIATPTMTLTFTPVPPTNTPTSMPTETSTPTFTPTPVDTATPTLISTTDPNTVLVEGETAYGDGISVVTAVACVLDADCVGKFTVIFTIKNISEERVGLPHVDGSEFFIELDNGTKVYSVGDWVNGYRCDHISQLPPQFSQETLQPGGTYEWAWSYTPIDMNNCKPGVLSAIRPIYTIPIEVETFTVHVPQLGKRFSGAQWQDSLPR
ncbi:MAG: hypothetical protein KDE47_11480 [Caldilineaceae bacterium]|nr:hypothetical protein [Caldilineaceae bacterium]MCB0105764.1 hypothetical protein [Caldilineaceae bacterium]